MTKTKTSSAKTSSSSSKGFNKRVATEEVVPTVVEDEDEEDDDLEDYKDGEEDADTVDQCTDQHLHDLKKGLEKQKGEVKAAEIELRQAELLIKQLLLKKIREARSELHHLLSRYGKYVPAHNVDYTLDIEGLEAFLMLLTKELRALRLDLVDHGVNIPTRCTCFK